MNGEDSINALHTLPLEAHVPRNLRNGKRPIYNFTEDLPASARQGQTACEFIAGSEKFSIQAERLQNKIGEHFSFV